MERELLTFLNKQLFLITLTAISHITALEKIFLITYPAWECVLFKMLSREILSTKVICDLIPSHQEMKENSPCFAEINVCDTNTWCNVGGLLYEKPAFV